jgi:hypothetical protein
VSATIVGSIRPDGAQLTATVGPTSIPAQTWIAGETWTVTAGAYTFTIKDQTGATIWQQTSVAIADTHEYALPGVVWGAGGPNTGTVTQIA